MSKITLLKREQHKKVAWKNGRGVTAEIAIDPPQSQIDDLSFEWRLSSAPILEAGPFSKFPEYSRHITLLQGKALKLLFPGTRRVESVSKDNLCHFAGEDEVLSELPEGPVTDVNFIYKRDLVSPIVQILKIEKAERAILFRAKHILLFALSGKIDVSVDLDKEKFSLEEQCTLRIDLATEVQGIKVEKNCLLLFAAQADNSSLLAIEIS